MMASDDATLRQLLEPRTRLLGYELVSVQRLGSVNHPIVRLYIDHEKGITLEDCELVSDEISTILDVEDPIFGQYRLEISSPGANRPLVKQQHFKQAIGQQIQLRLAQPKVGRRRFTGRLTSVSSSAIAIKIDDTEVELMFSEIESANLKPQI